MKKEEYEQAMKSYKKGYEQMSDLCTKILKDMKKQFWITLLIAGMWLITGIFWGIEFARWWS
ncbi:hypothetical protein LCGC14_2655220 [marine sediment metagenome]|uniref:Uncharacterized protein n=1 Tax=marine sediment metagenome TaxID=412755 RepID=A0A0F9CKM2_9ZZZZ